MMQKEERAIIQTVAALLQGNAHYYDEWIEKGSRLPNIAEQVKEDARQKRVKNELDRQTYEQYRNMMRDLIRNYEQRKKREAFLSEPKDEMECRLERKPGISVAKMNTSKVLLVFNDGEELEVDYDEHNGLLIRVGHEYYSSDEGL